MAYSPLQAGAFGRPPSGRRHRVAPRVQNASPESIPVSAVCAGRVNRPAVEVDCKLIAPDLALDRLHLIVPDGSDAMVVLEAWANGSHPGADPRSIFAERISEVGHVSVSFSDDAPPQLRLDLPDLSLQTVPQNGDGARDHLGLRVVSIRPTQSTPDAVKLLTITARRPVVTADNGVASDTFRLLDWREATQRAAKSDQLYATLKLVESLERAEKLRAQNQRTRFLAAREYWRCRNCRALWRPDTHERCPSCGREFTAVDLKQPEVGKVEFSVPPSDQINLTPDAAVLVEPEDEPNFVGRVSRIDHARHTVEIVTRTFEHAGDEGTITPSFNKALYQAKRSVLAAVATRDFGVGLLSQLLVAPELIVAPTFEDHEDTGDWLTQGMIANEPQNRAVALVSDLAAGQAVFIQGPPGTGKTTVIVEAIKRRLQRNPEERILMTSHSNLAVDNALERLAGTAGLRAVRVARAERVHPAVERFRVEDEDDPRLMEANCYFATCATAATSAITDMNFDIVILDEANKARSDEALPALRLGSALALVGDHKQLPPVEDDALYGIVEVDPALEDLVNRSLFEQCWDGGLPEAAQCLLTIQHRMHPDIAAYVSAASYDGQLENALEVCDYSYITRKPFPVAMHFVDTEGMRGGRERRGPGGALRNEAEVKVAAQVVRILDERAPRELTMAVIAMYAEQVERLRQALGRRRFKRSVKIDTVDSFEGREEDIVVISLVRSNERGRIGFLRVPNRLNVAISRAKRLVACIGDSATLRSGEESMYGQLVEAARSTGGWLPALELVQPPSRRRNAGRTEDAEGAEADPGAEPGRRRRRRRRRGRRGATPEVTAAAGEEAAAATTSASPNGEAAMRPDGTARRRRRRRRRRSQSGGVQTGAAETAVDSVATDNAPVAGTASGSEGNHTGPSGDAAPSGASAPPPAPIVLPGELITGSAVVRPQEATGD